MEQGMLNENQNKGGWKSRLENLDELSGETCRDKNALWQKLDSRLNENQRRTRVVWYWAAAACLLVGLLFPFIKGNRIPADTVKVTAEKIQPATNNLTATASLLKKESTEQKETVIEKKQAENKSLRPLNHQAIAKNNTLQEEVTVKKPADNLAQQQPVVIVDTVTATQEIPVLIAARTPVLKQKLKVVHNNELGDIIEDNHANEHISEHHTIRIEFMSQGIFTSVASSSSESGYNIFKTKTSPSN